MLTIQDMFQNQSKIDEGVLVEVSDQLWKLGSLQEIKEKVSEDLFVVHVGINMIGNWKNDGWWCLICEQAYLVPYIPDVLKIFEMCIRDSMFNKKSNRPILHGFVAFYAITMRKSQNVTI